MSVNQTNMTTYDHCHDDPSVFMYKSTVLTKGSNNNINNSLLDKAQQITMRNPCSHTMTILYQYSLCKKTIQVYID